MNNRMISAVVLIAVGITLFLLGMNSADSISDRFSNFFTGHFTEYTTWLLVLGVAAGVAGLVMLMTAGGRREAL